METISNEALAAARAKLDAAESRRENILLFHIANGVNIESRTVQIDEGVVIAPGATILAGTILRGTVRNITDFGAFVDIGLHDDGLIHISELSKRRVKHPLEVVSIGQVLRVMVISVDEKRGRIGLSLKQVPQEASV